MDIQLIIAFLSSPEFYALLVVLLAVLKGVAELLELIGRLRHKTTWSDKAAGTALEWVETAGKFVNMFAPGNKPKD